MTPESPTDPEAKPRPRSGPKRTGKPKKGQKEKGQKGGKVAKADAAKVDKAPKTPKPARPKLDRVQKQRQAGADYLRWLFGAGLTPGARYDRPGAAMLMRNAHLRDALMIPRNAVPLIAAPAPRAVKEDRQDDLRELYLWLLQADWPELIGPAGMAQLAEAADLPTMLAAAAPEIGPALETALDGGRDFPRPRRPEATQIGLYASALAVHGRYKRALAILHWLDGVRPGHPATAKRMANICWMVGNQDAAMRWLRAAFSAAPDNALLHLAIALRLTEAGEADDGQSATALAHIEKATGLWPELDLAIGAGIGEGA